MVFYYKNPRGKIFFYSNIWNSSSEFSFKDLLKNYLEDLREISFFESSLYFFFEKISTLMRSRKFFVIYFLSVIFKRSLKENSDEELHILIYFRRFCLWIPFLIRLAYDFYTFRFHEYNQSTSGMQMISFRFERDIFYY